MKSVKISDIIKQLQHENDELEMAKSIWEKRMSEAVERYREASKEYTIASKAYDEIADNQYHRVAAIRELRHLSDMQNL